MAFSVMIRGFEIQCETAEDVIRLVETASKDLGILKEVVSKNRSLSAVVPPSAQSPPSNGIVISNGIGIGTSTTTLDFLQTIAKGGGASAQEIVDALGLKTGRGIGGAMNRIKRDLRSRNFLDTAEVFSSTRDKEGRKWIAGPRIREAIHAFENAVERE